MKHVISEKFHLLSVKGLATGLNSKVNWHTK